MQAGLKSPAGCVADTAYFSSGVCLFEVVEECGHLELNSFATIGGETVHMNGLMNVHDGCDGRNTTAVDEEEHIVAGRGKISIRRPRNGQPAGRLRE